MLYRITLWTPMTHERGFQAQIRFTVATLHAVELEAAKLLPPAYETSYSARRDRHPSMLVQAIKGRVVQREWEIATPIRYVPSCGDLGWCP